MKAPIHSVDNPRPFMPWDDRSCCLKCSPQWLPRWHMHGRRDSFFWTHCRTTFQAQGWNLPERAQIQEMRKYWTGPVQSFKQQLLIYDSLSFGTCNRWVLFRACLVNSVLVVVVMMMLMVVVVELTIVLVMLNLVGANPMIVSSLVASSIVIFIQTTP